MKKSNLLKLVREVIKEQKFKPSTSPVQQSKPFSATSPVQKPMKVSYITCYGCRNGMPVGQKFPEGKGCPQGWTSEYHEDMCGVAGCADPDADNYNPNAIGCPGSSDVPNANNTNCCDYSLDPDPDDIFDFYSNTYCCGNGELPSGGVAQGTACYNYLGQLVGYANTPCGSGGGGGFGGGGLGGFGGFGGIDFEESKVRSLIRNQIRLMSEQKSKPGATSPAGSNFKPSVSRIPKPTTQDGITAVEEFGLTTVQDGIDFINDTINDPNVPDEAANDLQSQLNSMLPNLNPADPIKGSGGRPEERIIGFLLLIGAGFLIRRFIIWGFGG